jgi:hypothetical protein
VVSLAKTLIKSAAFTLKEHCMRPYRRGKKGFQKQQGKGTLESMDVQGPYVEWVGMPEYYLHNLTIDGQEYSYQAPEKELDLCVGDLVVFRFFSAAKGLKIDRRSLGRWIDPSEFNTLADD